MRNYSSVAVDTTLTGSVTAGATSLTVAATTGFPAPPFTIIVDKDTASEEIMEVTAVAGLTLTVSRGSGVDGTPAVSHSAGAKVQHGVSARDFREPNAHIEDTTAVHGISDTTQLVYQADLLNFATREGVETLKNKTIDGNLNTLLNLPVGKGWTYIGSASPSGVSSVTLSGLSGYDEIVVDFQVAGTQTATITTTFNGDTANKYTISWRYLSGTDQFPFWGPSVDSYGGFGWQGVLNTYTCGGTIHISGCKSTTAGKRWEMIATEPALGSTGQMALVSHTGVWSSTAALSSWVLTLSAGTFTSSTQFRIWGR